MIGQHACITHAHTRKYTVTSVSHCDLGGPTRVMSERALLQAKQSMVLLASGPVRVQASGSVRVLASGSVRVQAFMQ